MTYREIAEELSSDSREFFKARKTTITPKGVRKIVKKALKKMHDNPEAMDLLRKIAEQYEENKPIHGLWDELEERSWTMEK